MITSILRRLILITLLVIPQIFAAPKNALITLFSDPVGATGLSLWEYPIRAGGKQLFPVAVYGPRVKSLKYRILKIQRGNKSIFGHVVDECPKSVGICRENHKKAARKNAMLLDVHQTAWGKLGLNKHVGIYSAKITVVGKKIKRKGYVSNKWA